MAHTYHDLRLQKVADLREIAKELGDVDALHGYTSMHKDHLVVALCKALGIESHEHHDVVGIDKAAIKAQIKVLKTERDTAIQSKDYQGLKQARRKIHKLKRQINRATV